MLYGSIEILILLLNHCMISETGQSFLPKHPIFLQQEWNTFFDSFSQLGHEEIANRSQDIMRFLKENGVTYQMYNDPGGLNRP
jgi:uncharacterized circularly permuted ATP-grasp superfamily protein